MKKIPDKENLLMMYESGMSLWEIGNHLGVSETLVYNKLKDHPLYEARSQKAQVDSEQLLKLYNSGMTTSQIAEKLGIGNTTVKKYLKKNPKYISRRYQKEQLKIPKEKRREKNHGGSRPGSGAKPKEKQARVTVSFLLEPEHRQFILTQSKELEMSQSDFLNSLLDEYLELTTEVKP